MFTVDEMMKDFLKRVDEEYRENKERVLIGQLIEMVSELLEHRIIEIHIFEGSSSCYYDEGCVTSNNFMSDNFKLTWKGLKRVWELEREVKILRNKINKVDELIKHWDEVSKEDEEIY